MAVGARPADGDGLSCLSETIDYHGPVRPANVAEGGPIANSRTAALAAVAVAAVLLAAGLWRLWGSAVSPTSRPTRPTPDVSVLEPLVPFEAAGRWGYRRAGGEVVIPATFDDVQDRFDEAFAYARLDGRRGLIDRRGAWHVGPRDWNIGPYREGRAAIGLMTADGHKWGFIDSEGVVVIPARYDAVDEFRGGVARVGNETSLSRLRTAFADVGIEVDWHHINREGNRVD